MAAFVRDSRSAASELSAIFETSESGLEIETLPYRDTCPGLYSPRAEASTRKRFSCYSQTLTSSTTPWLIVSVLDATPVVIFMSRLTTFAAVVSAELVAMFTSSGFQFTALVMP